MTSTITMAAVQDAKDPKNTIFTINAVRVNNTTSPEEKRHGSMHYTVCCPVKEIYHLGLEDNVRDYYGSPEVKKNLTSIHKEIKSSFEKSRTRFIQRHAGFTIVCNSIVVPETKEFGINTIKMTGASLINGAQSQGIIREISEEYGGELDGTNIRVEIIVESNQDEVKEIAIARNTSNNVSVLSRMGTRGCFKVLAENMIDMLGEEDGKIQISETDDAIDTRTLLQAIKVMTPESLEEDHRYKKLKKSAVSPYSSKAGVLTEFRTMITDNKNGGYDDMLNFYHSFSGHAWKLFQSWTTDMDWKPFLKKAEALGVFKEKEDTFSASLGVIYPVLYGLKNFLEYDTGAWKFNLPANFDKKAYMEHVVNLFNERREGGANGDPQTFGKSEANYLKLDKYIDRTYMR